MPMPNAKMTFIRGGGGSVKFESKVDTANYSIRELTRAAMRDVGRYVSRNCNVQAQKLRGLKKSRRARGRTSAFQFWVRKQETDLQVGIKHGTWYGTQQELGDARQPKRGILQNTVSENIRSIRDIEAQYLSAVADEQRARSLIESEGDYQGGGEDD